jgi:hypothetical protein
VSLSDCKEKQKSSKIIDRPSTSALATAVLIDPHSLQEDEENLVSEVGLDFAGSCSLHDGAGTRPGANNGAPVATTGKDGSRDSCKQEEMKADINDEAKTRQDNADAEEKSRLKQLKGDIKGHMVANIISVRSDLEQTIQKRMEGALACVD